MNLGELTATLGIDTKDLRRAEGEFQKFSSNVESQTADVTKQMAKLAVAIGTVYVAYKSLSGITSVGMRVETLGIALNAVARNAKVSADDVNYYVRQVKSAGITTAETMSALTKGLALGLPMESMKKLATTARDIAVVAGKNTSETLASIMHAIESRQPEILRNLGIQVQNQEDIFKDYSAALGKTTKELTALEKQHAMLNAVLDAGSKYANVAADADASIGKQLASMSRYAEEAQLALWSAFEPGMSAGVKTMTLALKELSSWADKNRTDIEALGQSIGKFAAKSGESAISVMKWAAENTELIKTLLELYIVYKTISWIIGLVLALEKAYLATRIATAGFALFSTTATVASSGALGLAGSINVVSASLQTLKLSAIAATGAITGLFVAFAYGAVKHFQDLQSNADEYVDVPGVGLVHSAVKQAEKQKKRQESLDLYEQPLPQSAWDYRRAGEAAARDRERIERELEEARKKFGDKAGKAGGGGKGAEGALKRLEQMTLSWEEEITRLTGSGLKQLDAWYAKELKKISDIEAKGAEATAARAKLEELKVAKVQKLNEDYNSWYIGATSDTLGAIAAENKELLRKWGGDKEKEAQIAQVIELKKYQYWTDMEQKKLDSAARYAQEAQGLSVFPKEQLAYQKHSIEIQHQQNMMALQRGLLEKKITPEIYQQSVAYEAMLNKMRQFQAQRKAWETEGFAGGMKGWAVDRAEVAAKRGYQSALDFMQDLEGTISGSISSAIINGFRGKKVDVEEVFFSIVESGIKRAVDSFVGKGFDKLAELFRKGMGIEEKKDPMVVAAETAKVTLDAAGLSVAAQMEAGAYRTASILMAAMQGGYGMPAMGGGMPTTGGFGGYGPVGTTAYGTQYGGIYGGTVGGAPAAMGATAGGMMPTQPGAAFGGGGGSDILAALSKFLEVTKALSSSALKLTGSSTKLTGSSTKLTGSSGELTGSAGNLTDSSAFSQAQFAISSAGLAAAGLGVLTGSKELQTAGMVLSLAATALQVAVILMKASSILPFHHGGIITAHQGWGPDSRVIHAKVGEGVLRERAMSTMRRAYGPGAFNYLNRHGVLPGGGSDGQVNVTINPRYEMTKSEWERNVRLYVVPAMDELAARRGN